MANKFTQAAGAAWNAFSGVWFGPGRPIDPTYKTEAAAEAAGVAGRAWDYAAGYNIAFSPRTYERIGFARLREASWVPVVRMLIETIKDQVCQLNWDVAPRLQGTTVPQSRLDAARKVIQIPAPYSTRDSFLRKLLEDDLTVGAPSVYIRKTISGDYWGCEIIDGTTISPLIDEFGRIPIDGPAYRQIIKGMPVVEYWRDELIYNPMRPVNGRLYATSPVEQILPLVDIIERRHAHLKRYYTEGTVPDGIAGAPEGWSAEQIQQWQGWHDRLIAAEDSGIDKRRSLRFMPARMAETFKQTREAVLTDKTDEWLMRLLCYAFSIDPTPFVSQMNRATAQQARDTAIMEGLEPRKKWLAETYSFILDAAGYSDVKLIWPEGQISDPMIRTQVTALQLSSKLITIDEAREQLGRPAFTPQQVATLAAANPPPPPPPAAPIPAPAPAPAPAPEGNDGDAMTPAEAAKALGVAPDPVIVETAVHLHVGDELVQVIRGGA